MMNKFRKTSGTMSLHSTQLLQVLHVSSVENVAVRIKMNETHVQGFR